MPLEVLLFPVNLTDSDSDGIDGGTGCNFIFYIRSYSHGILNQCRKAVFDQNMPKFLKFDPINAQIS